MLELKNLSYTNFDSIIDALGELGFCLVSFKVVDGDQLSMTVRLK